MTQMYPPENDPYQLHLLVLSASKRFDVLAQELKNHPYIIESDIGFESNAHRDGLPIFGIRGKIHNHIFDGHHRTIREVWNGGIYMDCLTAY